MSPPDLPATLNVFTDIQVEPALLERLRTGIEPHRLLVPSAGGTSVLEDAPIDAQLAEAHIALGQPAVAGVLGSKNLRWLQVSTASITRYDTPEFRSGVGEKQLVVTNSSPVYDQACAEHLLAFMLAQARQLPRALATVTPSGTDTWYQLRASCRLLRGQTVLIVGYGSIAEKLVGMLAPFAMRVRAVRREPRGTESVNVLTPDQIYPALATADHVINILPDSESTRDFFSTKEFAVMKHGATFYNIGRGTTVDQNALAQALQEGLLSAAWLDVTEPEPLPADHPLFALENCHITPHTGGGQKDDMRDMVEHFLENFARFLKGDELLSRVM
ncbi:phosphoglycerate dehydrogenase-like enzyme [Roseimicrobium gellanilyticum]|uniref:Phosphoglycerate dehydrogenase-like enzyme n=1 Tax=Roseimicrobium gellanilyticum TaxID=748857 RepID=A0A366HL65_9BACT|nr:D-2-hydroxyacid dehydrogenase [Roseimicrobium gellanilyticum]RBP43689.1 phosphoglycerate dehydrogenase-like enzyme [Roseimicrobium gellanilyticum]